MPTTFLPRHWRDRGSQLGSLRIVSFSRTALFTRPVQLSHYFPRLGVERVANPTIRLVDLRAGYSTYSLPDHVLVSGGHGQANAIFDVRPVNAAFASLDQAAGFEPCKQPYLPLTQPTLV